jgi:gluconolactonase
LLQRKKSALSPAQLEARKSTGRFSFHWYRIRVTIPEKIGNFDPSGSTVIFELVIDDYAEIWVNGNLPTVFGHTGGQLVKGFNAPNRVVLSRSAQPGQQFQLAIFGMNAPVPSPPGNFIWVRSATLDFYMSDQAYKPQEFTLEITRKDPALDAIIPANAKLEQIATGFLFTEGPVWVPAVDGVPGYLLFSDPNANTIYRWSQDGQVSVYKTKSGYTGVNVGEYNQPGSNGLTLDKEGRVTINEHGNRRVTRLEKTGALTVLADRYEVNEDCTLANGKVFFDLTSAPGEDAIDGVKVDQKGNLYVSGPGGLWILSPAGKHLGALKGPEHPHNLAWGDEGGKTLYLTAQTSVYRIRLNIPGVCPGAGRQ